jgi:TP901 family phage tail tape measure protein
MSMIVGITTVGTQRAMREVQLMEATVKKASMSMLLAGRALTQFISLPTALIAGASTKIFADYEANIAKIIGLVGIAKDVTNEWNREILSMSKDVAKSPKELSDALYYITSSGFKGAESISILNASAKAAAAGLGETKNVADIVTSAMNAYGKANLQASYATDVLVATVREGKGEPEELARAFATVIPIAAKLNVGFDQVGGALASLTRLGIPAATAAVYLRQTLFTLTKPSKQTRDALEKMGTSAQELRDSLQNKGLLPTLRTLAELTNKWGEEAMSRVFPNIRAFMGVISLLQMDVSEINGVFEAVTNSTGDMDKAFAVVSETFKYKLNKALASGSVMLIKIGEIVAKSLIPIIENLGKIFEEIGNWFEGLTAGEQRFLVKTALIVTVLGPVLLIFKALTAGAKALFSFFIPIIGAFKSIDIYSTKATRSMSAAVAAQRAYANATTYVVTEIITQNNATRATSSTIGMQTIVINDATSTIIRHTAALDFDAARQINLNRVSALLDGTILYGNKVIVMSGIAWSNHAKMLEYDAVRQEYLNYVLSKTSIFLLNTGRALDYNVSRYIRITRAQELLNAVTIQGNRIIALNELTLTGQNKALLAITPSYARIIRAQEILNGVLIQGTSIIEMNTTALAIITPIYNKIFRAIVLLTNSIAHGTEIIALNTTALVLSKNAQAKYISTYLSLIAVQETGTKSIVANTSALMLYNVQCYRTVKAHFALIASISRGSSIIIGETVAFSAQAKALGYNIIRYERILRAQSLLNGTVVNGTRVLIPNTTALALNSIAKDKNAGSSIVLANGMTLQTIATGRSTKQIIMNTAAINTSRFSWGAFIVGISKVPKIPLLAALTALYLVIHSQVKKLTELTAVEKAEKKVKDEVAKSVGEEAGKLQALLSIANNEYVSRKKRLQVIEEINKISPEYLDGIRLETLNTNESKMAIDAYNASMSERIRLEALQALLTEEYIKHERDVRDGTNRRITLQQKLNMVFGLGADPLQVLLEKGKDWVSLSEKFGKINAKTYENDFVNTSNYYKDQINGINTIISTEKSWMYLQDQVQKALQDQNELQKLLKNTTKKGKEESLKFETKHQEHLGTTIALLKDVQDRAIQGKKLEENKFKTDIELNKQALNMANARNEKERQIAEEAYNDRRNILKKEVNLNIAKNTAIINNTKANIEKLNKYLKNNRNIDTGDDIIDPDTLEETIKDIAKIWEEYEKGLNSARQSAALFGTSFTWTDELELELKTIENTFKELSELNPVDFKKMIQTPDVQYMLDQFKSLTFVDKIVKETNTSLDNWTESTEKAMDSMIELMNQEAAATNITDGLASSLAMLALQGANMGEYFDKTSMTLEVVSAEITKLEKSITPLTVKQKELLKALYGWRDQLVITGIAEDMAMQLQDLENKVSKLDGVFDSSAEKLRIYKAMLSSLLYMDISKFDLATWEKWLALVKQIKDNLNSAGKEMSDIASGVSSMIVDTISTFAESIGQLFAGLKTGKDVFDDLIGSMADGIISIGKLMVALGTAIATVLINPVLGIVLGAGLIALGSFIKGTIEKRKTAAGMAEGGIVPAGYPNDSYPAKLTSGEMVIPPMKLPEFERAQAVDVTVKVEGVAKGQDLYYVVKEVERRYKNAH